MRWLAFAFALASPVSPALAAAPVTRSSALANGCFSVASGHKQLGLFYVKPTGLGTAMLYDRDARFAGKSKFDYWRLWNFSLEGITSFTTAPLKLASYVGLATSVVAAIYGAVQNVKTVAMASRTQKQRTLFLQTFDRSLTTGCSPGPIINLLDL